MFVGVGRFVLQIPSAASLKDRRRVVKSAKERLRARLAVSIAEVGDVERLQVATLGAAVVARDSGLCTATLSEVRAVLGGLGDAVLCDVTTEILSFEVGGKGIQGGIEKVLDEGTVEGSWAEFSGGIAERSQREK